LVVSAIHADARCHAFHDHGRPDAARQAYAEVAVCWSDRARRFTGAFARQRRR
jgi:hypothetical protein